MRISLNWLNELIPIDDLSVDDLAYKLTMLGLEIESIERMGADIDKVVVGKLLSIEPHPEADKLVVCKTDVGEREPLVIVCGAKNMQVGDLVPTAVVGATLPGGFKIGKRKMRGIQSHGMMCSADELGLGEDHSGLLILDPNLTVGEDAKKVLGLDDVVLEIEVTPNRGDWASMVGVARELSALLGRPHRMPETSVEESGRAASDLSSVTIEAPDLCPRYAGRVLEGASIAPSPAWMCQRLVAGGLRPINNIVDVTNYVLLETGHPLHAFDYNKLNENRIVVRTARPGETLKTIDGEERALQPDMLVIADAKNPVAVAGVMGGLESEVGEGTTNIFLESAYFNPKSVRKTARALGMQTEASARFQRGADPEMAVYAANRAADLMQKLAGAQVARGLLDEYPKPVETNQVTLRYARSDLLLGGRMEPDSQRKVLVSLGFTEVKSDTESVTVQVPTWRHDVSIEADLIEEVARFFDYERVPSSIPAVRKTEVVFAPEDAKMRRLRDTLISGGLTEIMGMTFSSPEQVKRAGLAGAYLDMVALQNPLSEHHATMRTTLIPGLLATVARNVHHGNLDIRIFELGPVYRPNASAELPDQINRLGVALSGNRAAPHWNRKPQLADIYDLKGHVETALERWFGPCTFEDADLPCMHPGQCGAVLVNSTTVGYMGQVRSEVLAAFDLDQDVYLAEIDIDPLLTQQAPAPEFEPLGKFPPSLRDMSVMVDISVPAGNLRDAAERVGGALLKRADIFDVYTGEQVPKGKKSIALSLVLQSKDRTLTDKQTQKVCDTILATLQTEFGAELR